MNRLFTALCLLLVASGPSYSQKPFTFVFMTDIHVQPQQFAAQGLEKAIGRINREKPDFVVTGGDLVMDALGEGYARADSLYNLYSTTMKNLKMPVWNTSGNHEHFAVYAKSGDDTLNPEAGTKLFEHRIGKTYQSFTHNGWKFFLLNSIGISARRKYYGGIDSLQLDWIKRELAGTDTTTPIIIVTHIPFRTVWVQVTEVAAVANGPMDVIANANQVLDLFDRYNLKLVLQGHMHYYEEIHVRDTWFVTGGSIAASWWDGPYMGVPEGYLVVKAGKTDVSWEYKPYGWVAVK
jgi:3',5'-cyclic-AMP phosphodiesterase